MRKKTIYAIIAAIILALALDFLLHHVQAGANVFKYEAKGKRDPFIPLIGQEKGVRAGLENISSIQDLNLEGIAVGPTGKNIAILNGQMVKEKDKFGALEIKKISPKSIELSIEGTGYTLTLQEPEKGKQE